VTFAPEDSLVLVDEHDTPLGEAGKLDVHRRGLRHRAFSLFAFNADGELLLQRRAEGKYHSPGLWSNTACGHPRPGEAVDAAARRRLADELGVTCGELRAAGVLHYRTELGDLVENEVDHLLVTRVDATPAPDPAEVAAWRFVGPLELATWLEERPEEFTAWFEPAWRIVAGA
jgi:isopentenyl-diphosphate delta-isomerase